MPVLLKFISKAAFVCVCVCVWVSAELILVLHHVATDFTFVNHAAQPPVHARAYRAVVAPTWWRAAPALRLKVCSSCLYYCQFRFGLSGVGVHQSLLRPLPAYNDCVYVRLQQCNASMVHAATNNRKCNMTWIVNWGAARLWTCRQSTIWLSSWTPQCTRCLAAASV